MTPTQLTAFKTAILADATLTTDVTAGNHQNIADYYNANHAARQVWKPKIMVRELNTAVDWAAFVALTAVKQNGYMAMTQGGFIDATSAGVRAGFTAVFGAGSTSLTNLTAIAQRLASRFEALDAFWTATSGQSGVTSQFDAVVTATDVAQALSS